MASKCNNLLKLFKSPVVVNGRFQSSGKPVLGEQYKKFQSDDGIPVHMKGGFSDRILFVTSIVLIGIGVVNGLYSLLSMAFPKRK